MNPENNGKEEETENPEEVGHALILVPNPCLPHLPSLESQFKNLR
jgi:hypothetical protein